MKKYICFGLVLFTIFIYNSKAVVNNSLGLTIGDGTFYSLSAYPTYQDIGFQLPLSVSSDELWTAIPTDTAHSYGQNGGALSQCGMSFKSNNYYSVTYNFLIGTTDYYIHPNYTSWSYKVGVCNSKSCIPNSKLESVSSDIQTIKYDDNYLIGSFTTIFKAPNDGTCVSLAFSSYNKSTPVQLAEFVGYSYDFLGSDNLTSDDIKNALSSDFNDLKNNIEDTINDNFNSCRTSNNLLDTSSIKSVTKNGLTITNNGDGTITLNGTVTADFGYNFMKFSLSSGTYYFSDNSSLGMYIYDYNSLTGLVGSNKSVTLSSAYNNLGLDFYFNAGKTYNNLVIKPMLNLGSTKLSFEKYGEICVNKIDETNSKLDDITNLEPDNSDTPDSSKYDDYSSAEDSLLDKANDVDLDSLDIPIDSDTSNFIWDTMSSLFSSHPLVFSTFLALLSVGVIKLVLGR